MKPHQNPFVLLLHLAMVVEIALGNTLGRPNTALASAPGDIPAVLALQTGNHAPVAFNDPARIGVFETAVTIDVLANDSDVDGDALAVSSVSQPEHGVATHDGADVTYIPNTGYCGADTFTYVVSDGHGGSDAATVTVGVCSDDKTITTAPDLPGGIDAHQKVYAR